MPLKEKETVGKPEKSAEEKNTERKAELERSETRAIHRDDERRIRLEIDKRFSQKEDARELYDILEAEIKDKNHYRPNRIAFKSIPAILEITGMTYKDLLEITNAETDGNRADIHWPKPVEEKMCALCDSLDEAAREQIYEIVLDLLPEPLREILFMEALNTEKVVDSVQLRSYDPRHLTSVMNVSTSIRDTLQRKNQSLYRIKFFMMKYLAENLDVSYHWMLGLDSHDCVLAKHGTTEMIMDAFCLLPDSYKAAVAGGVEIYERGFF